MIRFLFILFLPFLLSGADKIYASFSVEAAKSASLAFDASGIVSTVLVDVASEVKKNDILAKLADEDLVASLNVTKAEYESAKIAYEYATRDYERYKSVKDVIDESKFDSFELAYKRAKTTLEQAKANVTYKEVLLSKSKIVAPFDGVIFEKNVEVGDVVAASTQKNQLKIQSKHNRKLILEFDQKYFDKVKVGQMFSCKIGGDELSAKIVKIYPSANIQNRKLKAEAYAKDVLVGYFGDGYIEVE